MWQQYNIINIWGITYHFSGFQSLSGQPQGKSRCRRSRSRRGRRDRSRSRQKRRSRSRSRRKSKRRSPGRRSPRRSPVKRKEEEKKNDKETLDVLSEVFEAEAAGTTHQHPSTMFACNH